LKPYEVRHVAWPFFILGYRSVFTLSPFGREAGWSNLSDDPYPLVWDSNWNKDLKNIRNKELSERRNTAGDAKAALLEAYRAAKAAAEPTREAKQAERIAVAEAREARRTERDQAKRDEQNRLAAEKAAHEAALALAATAEADARELADKNRIARVLEDEAARKAERDQRYANRKARQG
jgi:hypothetical protein